MQTDVLEKLLYVDGMTEDAKTETKMQVAMDRVSQVSGNYDLIISTNRSYFLMKTWIVRIR